MKNMPAVIFSLIAGTTLGIIIHLGENIQRAAGLMQKVTKKFIKTLQINIPQDEFMTTLITVIILFCASGTGIYGSIVCGMTSGA